MVFPRSDLGESPRESLCCWTADHANMQEVIRLEWVLEWDDLTLCDGRNKNAALHLVQR